MVQLIVCCVLVDNVDSHTVSKQQFSFDRNYIYLYFVVFGFFLTFFTDLHQSEGIKYEVTFETEFKLTTMKYLHNLLIY